MRKMKNIYIIFVLLLSYNIAQGQNESIPSLKILQGIWKYEFNSESGIDSTFEMYRLIRNDTMVVILNDNSYSKPTIQFSIIGFQNIQDKLNNIKELKSSGNDFCAINLPSDVDSVGDIKRISSACWMTINENGKDYHEPDYINMYIKSIPETYTHNKKLPQDLLTKLKKNNQLIQILNFL
jgi:hypothetical protein